jgi:hypothetical protein
MQRLAQRQHISLAAAVHAVQQFRLERDDRRDVDDGAIAARHQSRRGGAGQAGQRGDVHVDQRVQFFRRRIDQRFDGAEAGVIDQHGDAAVAGQTLLDAAQVGAHAEVGGDGLDPAAGLASNRAASGQLGGVARHQDQVVATAGQTVGVDSADARGSAGNQCGFHGVAPFRLS